MFTILKKLLFDFSGSSPEDSEMPILEKSQEKGTRFSLKDKNKVVGELLWDGNNWHFSYNQEYIADHPDFKLSNFPDTSKTYQSANLWPFFMLRIPTADQPIVKRFQESKTSNTVEIDVSATDLKTNDPVLMLKLFGRYSTANPYILVSEPSNRM